MWAKLAQPLLPAIAVLALTYGGCAGDREPTMPQSPAPTTLPRQKVVAAGHPELPEGWRRVQVRNGFVGRELEEPLVGFTVALPPGWTAGESLPGTSGPTGWIAGPPVSGGERVPYLYFWMGVAPHFSANILEEDSRYDVRHLDVDGALVLLHLARPEAIDLGPQVGAYYERIPGGPVGLSLRFEGDSRGFNDQALLAAILTSARYDEIDELPPLPVPAIQPGEDWQRVPVRSDWPAFTLALPPGWSTATLQGIDSLVGTISGDGITLTYDFGGFAGAPYSELDGVVYGGHVPHFVWEESIGDGVYWFVRPVSELPDRNGVSGALIDLEGDPPRDRISSFLTPRVSLRTTGLDGQQQELVIAILRTIRPQD